MHNFIAKHRWDLAALSLTLTGIIMLWAATWLARYESPQLVHYNNALKMYREGDLEGAIRAFDQSLAAYEQAKHAGWPKSRLLPPPSIEVAALAHAHKGMAYLKQPEADIKPAIDAFKESLKLNPGNQYHGLSLSEAQRLHQQAYVVKHNLEMLYKENPAQGKKEGKGKGQNKSQKQIEQEGHKPDPGDDPSNMPGKGSRDAI